MSEKPTNPKDVIGVRKAPMSAVPIVVMAEVGVAMLEGAAKYGRSNYRAVGVRGSVYFDATMRHLFDWWEGTDIDPDSGMHHVTKAIASLVVLRDSMIQGKLDDDRPPPSAEFYERLNALAGAVLDRHADKNPKHYTRQDCPFNEKIRAACVEMFGDGGWATHDGSGCPLVSDALVEVIWRDKSRSSFASSPHGYVGWRHRGGSDDIIAYRVVVP